MGSTILSINSNISSLKAQRQLGTASSSITSSFAKLSSGLRINSASDDGAGLAVASSLRADTRIYSQGVRNLNDGISALNIADGALSNLSAIVTRMQELAEQAANGAVGWKQRKSLDAEAQALAEEYYRISRTTDFNGLNLLDGSLQGLSLQAGYGSSGSILSSLGGELGTGTFKALVSVAQPDGANQYGLSLSDLNRDGFLDMVTSGFDGTGGYAAIRLGNGDGTFRAQDCYRAEAIHSPALSLADLDEDGVLDLITGGYAGPAAGGGRTSIRLGNGDGTFRASTSYLTENKTTYALAIADINADGHMDMATTGSSDADWPATIRLGKGDGTLGESRSFLTGAELPSAITFADMNNDGTLDFITAGGTDQGSVKIGIGNGDGTFRALRSWQVDSEGSVWSSFAISVCDVDNDGRQDLVTAGADGSGGAPIGIRLGNGDGTFRSSHSYVVAAAQHYTSLATSDMNGDGNLDIVTGGSLGSTALRLGNGDGTFRASTSTCQGTEVNAVATGDLNGDGVMDILATGYEGGIGEFFGVRIAETRDGVSPILPFSLKTQADAFQAIPVFKGTLDRLSMQRGQIGAFQSRLSSAVNILGSTVLGYKGAQGRMEDVDVAGEAANLLRQQILQQTASGVLAQANQAPSLALKLIRG